MERAFLETIFLCGVALMVFLEIYYLQNFSADRKILNAQKKKRMFLFLLMLGMQVVPFVYIFSVDFGPTDYHLWKWLGFPVLLFFFFCIWLFVRAVSDLGRWWVPGQELKEDLELVTTGTYYFVRHPMYAALLGIAICQVFMIQNWIAGPISIFLATPFCIYQIRREERLLIKYFGDDYRHYMRETGMLWPNEDKMPLLKKMARQLLQTAKIMLVNLWGLLLKSGRRRSSKSVDGRL
jgi:protein-S-isoprenylcysteine O-methyltransferase Ste14